MSTTHKILFALVVALALFFLGRQSVGTGAAEDPASSATVGSETGAAELTLWTCPMHPQIKLPDPGDCPICGMDLVPMTSGGDEDPRQLVMSPAAKELARIEVEPVVRRNLTRPVRMVGKVDYDETLIRTISAWVAGRLDRLFVDYTGIAVKAGDHLVSLYSPELLTAQEELLSAKELLNSTHGEASAFLAESNRRAYEAARDKLLLWGLTAGQVDAIETRGTAEDHMLITSPSGGVVIDKLLNQGAYVKTGTPIYRIADLGRLWVRLDAYEQDLSWLRYGQSVLLKVEALPGETFEGLVSYVDPFIHEHTRTAKVRVIVNNQDGRLKPGMFVRAVAMSRIGSGGRVLDRGLAGKWVSPMHPEIVKDGPGQCDVCGMDLVPAEELGLVDELPADAERPLVVSSSSVLITGKRAVVYVEVPGRERPTYEGREVVLGPRAGDEYLILAGLEAGERVVKHGAFRIDSAMQILAKPSMMSMPTESHVLRGPAAEAFYRSLEPIIGGYLELQSALADDDFDAARAHLPRLRASLDAPVAAALPGTHRAIWLEDLDLTRAALERAEQAADIEALRAAFESLSEGMLSVVREIGYRGSENLFEVHCPMAYDNRGAAWLQDSDSVRNPYFGASMLTCGDVRTNFSPGNTAATDPHAAHGDHRPESTEQPEGPREGPEGTLAGVFRAYLLLQVSLAEDDRDAAATAVVKLGGEVRDAHHVAESKIADVLDQMSKSVESLASAPNLEDLRSTFFELSVQLIALEALVGNPLNTNLKLVHCPMAFDFEGADWVQEGDLVNNPYFGDEMLRCGSVKRDLERK